MSKKKPQGGKNLKDHDENDIILSEEGDEYEDTENTNNETDANESENYDEDEEEQEQEQFGENELNDLIILTTKNDYLEELIRRLELLNKGKTLSTELWNNECEILHAKAIHNIKQKIIDEMNR